MRWAETKGKLRFFNSISHRAEELQLMSYRHDYDKSSPLTRGAVWYGVRFDNFLTRYLEGDWLLASPNDAWPHRGMTA